MMDFGIWALWSPRFSHAACLKSFRASTLRWPTAAAITTQYVCLPNAAKVWWCADRRVARSHVQRLAAIVWTSCWLSNTSSDQSSSCSKNQPVAPDPLRSSGELFCRAGEHVGLERWGRGVLPRHTHAGPRSARRRGPSSGDLELTCLNNRRFLLIPTTFSTSL